MLAQKYFRKAGRAGGAAPGEGEGGAGVPVALGGGRGASSRACPRASATAARPARGRCSTGWPAPGPTGAGRAAISPARRTRAPISTRCASCWRRRWRRRTAPQWFNTGLHWAYGIDGPGQGHFYVDFETGRADPLGRAPTSIRSRMPASSSRWPTISSTTAASWTSGPARRGSSSTARAPARTSPSLRGENEPLAGGGKSSGLMSFLKIGDRAAGAIKSGGTTRRAAKMVICDLDHPDIEDFVNWKVIEEQKVASLVAGSKIHRERLDGDPGGDPRLGRRRGGRLRPQAEPGAEGGDPGGEAGASCPRPTSSGCSPRPRRGRWRSSSAPTTPTGIRTPI